MTHSWCRLLLCKLQVPPSASVCSHTTCVQQHRTQMSCLLSPYKLQRRFAVEVCMSLEEVLKGGAHIAFWQQHKIRKSCPLSPRMPSTPPSASECSHIPSLQPHKMQILCPLLPCMPSAHPAVSLCKHSWVSRVLQWVQRSGHWMVEKWDAKMALVLEFHCSVCNDEAMTGNHIYLHAPLFGVQCGLHNSRPLRHNISPMCAPGRKLCCRA